MANLPKNISLVSYKNKDGSKQLKYRVRLQVQGESINQLFDGLADAKAFLLEARSRYGRKALSELEIAEKKALDEYRQPKFEWFFDLYFDYKYPEPEFQKSLLKKKQYATYKSFFKTIKNTEVATFNEKHLQEAPQAVASLIEIGLGSAYSKRRKLGDFKLYEITFKTLNEYIKERKKLGKRLNTIRKEVSIISCFYQEIKHISQVSSEWTMGLGNPTKDIDKKLLDPRKFDTPKRVLPKRIDSDNFEKIKNCIYAEDLDFSYTLLLQYFGALRMAEAIYLTWENVDFENKRLFLPQTKTNPREVSITKDLEDLLETIEPDPSRRNGLVLRNQTYYKYQKQIQRFRKKYGFDLMTHTLRKDAIGRMIDKVGNNSIVLAEILGFTNVRNFETNHLEQGPDISTVEGIMRNIGHTEKSKNITKNNYYALPKLTYKK